MKNESPSEKEQVKSIAQARKEKSHGSKSVLVKKREEPCALALEYLSDSYKG